MTNVPILEETNPISVVVNLATEYEWEFDFVSEDQIVMAYQQGRWSTYFITLAWSACDSTLRLICAFETKFPAETPSSLFALLNKVNDSYFTGCFVYWPEKELMVYRYSLILGDQPLTLEQVDHIIRTAIFQCERFYPAFQLVTEGQTSVDEAYQFALGETYGRA